VRERHESLARALNAWYDIALDLLVFDYFSAPLRRPRSALMPPSNSKLFVPDQAIYWLDGGHPSKPINKRDWLQTHHLPEFEKDSKKSEKSPWTRIDGIKARNDFLKNLGPTGDASKRRLLCFTASAGVGKSIALEQIAYLRSLDSEHVVIRYHFSELPTYDAHFTLVGSTQRNVLTGKTKTLVTALLKTIFPLEEKDPKSPTVTDFYEQAILSWIKLKVAKGHVTLIVDGLDELNADLQSVTGAPGSERAHALSKLLHQGDYKSLHCVVAGRPYAINSDLWSDLFDSKLPQHPSNGGSDWEFCLAALFTENQSKQYLGSRYKKLASLRAQTPLTPRHLEVIRTLPDDRFGNLHSLACVYWEMLQASLQKDLTRKGNVGPFDRLRVPVTKEQYISYLAALASLTMEQSKDLLSLRLAPIQADLNNRVLQTPYWKLAGNTAEQKIELIEGLNSSSIEFNYLRQGNQEVIWKDRTVMDFFAALWMVRYSTQEQRTKICDQVPRRGIKGQLDENRRDLWTFIAGMPAEAFEQFGDGTAYDARWNELAKRLLQPFSDAQRPTQLMHIAWQELERRMKDQYLASAAKEVMDSFTQQYEDLRAQGNEDSKIIDEDLIFVPIKSLSDGSWKVAVGRPLEPDNHPRLLEELLGPYSVSKYPITRRLYNLFNRNHQVYYQDDFKLYSPEPRCPVIKVSWYDALMFSRWCRSRLLSEWEWEYACRGNRDAEAHQNLTHWQSDPKNEIEREKVAWMSWNSQDRTWPVDSKQAGSHTNAFGLVDMLGNVWEWTVSTHEADGVSRVLRGGSFGSSGRRVSASCRLVSDPTSMDFHDGFRVARAP
jgi:hypothetical protein